MKKILCTLLLISTFQFCSSQPVEQKPISGSLAIAIEHYQNGVYSKSINELQNILCEPKSDTIVAVHAYMAFNHVAIGDETEAIKHFKKALSLDPKLDLDVYDATPRIRQVFEKARNERARESAFCSCFIPGIGQIMKGDEGKGKAIIAASALTFAGTALSWLVMDNKHNYYLSLGPDDIYHMDQAYNDYNRWRKVTLFTAATFLGVYLYSFVDAMVVGKSTTRQDPGSSIGLYLNSNGESFCIGYKTGL